MAALTRRRRARIAVLALAVYPMLGVALFWAIAVSYDVLGEDALDWLPGATAVIGALGLSATLMALTAYRRSTSPPLAVLLVTLALVMTVVWFWLSWLLLIAIDGSSGDVYD